MSIKVGWIPSAESRDHPADRRRFGWFLRNINANVIVENAQKNCYYDVLYISISADLNYWSDTNNNLLLTNKNAWVVFDICDSLLKEPLYKSWLRPILRSLQGNSCTFKSYRSTIIRMIELSDSIVCGSLEQKKDLLEHNPNVHIVRDAFMQDFESSYGDEFIKDNNTVDLLWEGLANGNGKIFKTLSGILENTIQDFPKKKVVLHIVTDPTICKFSNYFCKDTYVYMQDMFNNNIEIQVHNWSAKILLQLSSIVDIALIPVPDDLVMKNKPENKLILYWFLKIPVICSKTEAYTRVMGDSDLLKFCPKEMDWGLLMKQLVFSNDERSCYLEKISNYIAMNYTEEIIMNAWKDVFKGSKLDGK